MPANSGLTGQGISFPIGSIDAFDPAGSIEETAESTDTQIGAIRGVDRQQDTAISNLQTAEVRFGRDIEALAQTANALQGEVSRIWGELADLGVDIGDRPGANDIQRLWPVGSVFFGAVATDPALLLGFGTWRPYAQGRFIVGQGRDNMFPANYGLGGTGGAETVRLTGEQSGMRTHNHTIPTLTTTTADANHTHTIALARAQGQSLGNGNGAYQDRVIITGGPGVGFVETEVGAARHNHTINGGSLTGGPSGATDAPQAHENRPPFLALAIWERVA